MGHGGLAVGRKPDRAAPAASGRIEVRIVPRNAGEGKIAKAVFLPASVSVNQAASVDSNSLILRSSEGCVDKISVHAGGAEIIMAAAGLSAVMHSPE